MLKKFMNVQPQVFFDKDLDKEQWSSYITTQQKRGLTSELERVLDYVYDKMCDRVCIYCETSNDRAFIRAYEDIFDIPPEFKYSTEFKYSGC